MIQYVKLSGKSKTMSKLRNHLLQAARDIVESSGVQAISMRGLGEVANVSRGAAYRHFSDKHDLLCALAGSVGNELSSALASSVNSNDSVKRQFQQMAKAYITFSFQSAERYALIFNSPDLHRNPTDELRQGLNEAFQRLVELIEIGHADNSIVNESIEHQANFVWSSLHGFCMLMLGRKEQYDIHTADQADFVINKLWRSLAR